MQDYEQITPDELLARLNAGERITLVDIREPFEWHGTGVIPGAQLIPMGAFAHGRFQEFAPERELVLVCAHGVRTATIAAALKLRGWQAARSLVGGMADWRGPVAAPSDAGGLESEK